MNTLSCPWSTFAPGTTSFCEARLCAWVESPGIAFAGIAYVVMAIAIFRALKPGDSWLTKSFAWITLSMGLSSFAYHSSHILFFQAWDLGSMDALATGIVVINLGRLFPSFTSARATLVFMGLLVGAILLFLLAPAHPGTGTFVAVLATGLLLEIPASRREPKFHYPNFWAALFAFALAIVARELEKSKYCDPENHVFQWHAVWDTFSAICYFFVYRHYRQAKL